MITSQFACQQIEFARQYTRILLDTIDPNRWFEMPAGCDTHIAWQVGHLAMAQYGLTMLRMRGKEPEDAEFISNDFIRLFAKGSQPGRDASLYPSPAEIRQVFDAVYERALQVIPTYSEQLLNEPAPEPYAVVPTKLGALLFCAAHEMLHAGQIGLIRRMLGMPPVR